MQPSFYSLRKSQNILYPAYSLFKKKGNRLSKGDLNSFEELLRGLERAILAKEQQEADQLARSVEAFVKTRFPKNIFDHLKEIAFALVFALVVATIIRQAWFEPYEIPSGSMRPTFREEDRLIVSKTAFGINIPLKPAHFYFDPKLVERTGVFIFTVENMDVADADTTYFYLFPGKKRFIKRCMGKPGDTLYFYGGRIYGIDKDGNDLPELRESPWMQQLDHVPFITFEGKITSDSLPDSRGMTSSAVFNQMDESLGRLSYSPQGDNIKGEIFDGSKWIADQPFATTAKGIHTYSDFWGMKNYAMARLLTKQQVRQLTDIDPNSLGEDGVLYLELRHTPSLSYPKPRLGKDEYGNIRPLLTPNTTVIPLQERHLKALMHHMYTSRLVFKNGKALSYQHSALMGKTPFSPSFQDVPDGSYEFFYGQAYSVSWGGICDPLPPNHPLYKQTPENIQRLFNLGIEMFSFYEPHAKNQLYFPSRYAYFRDGALYSMGGQIIPKDDPTLLTFLDREENLAQTRPYIPFKDHGSPLVNGKIDGDFIRTFGVTIPDKTYLALGDNYASSGDSRIFGFVPEDNLQGAPEYILWPPGPRWGAPAQASYPFINTPRLIVWGVAALVLLGWYVWSRRNRPPLFKKDE